MQISYEVREHSGLVESAPEVMNNDWPKYTSDLHLNNLDSLRRDQLLPKKRIICKILVIFSEDGVADSQNAIDISKTVENEVNKLYTCFDIFWIIFLPLMIWRDIFDGRNKKSSWNQVVHPFDNRWRWWCGRFHFRQRSL